MHLKLNVKERAEQGQIVLKAMQLILFGGWILEFEVLCIL